MKATKVPTYGLHKPTGKARCYINGKTVYLGKYGSEESRIRFGEIVDKLVSGQVFDPIARTKTGSTTCGELNDPGPSVAELCVVFLTHAETHYVKNGKQTSEVHILKSAMSPLKELYGMLPAKDFGPLALKAVRAKMVESGWCRGTINAAMSRIRRIFKHAIANELIESSVLDRLKCVAPLLAGRTEAHDILPKRGAHSRSHGRADGSGRCSGVRRIRRLARRKRTRRPKTVEGNPIHAGQNFLQEYWA